MTVYKTITFITTITFPSNKELEEYQKNGNKINNIITVNETGIIASITKQHKDIDKDFYENFIQEESERFRSNFNPFNIEEFIKKLIDEHNMPRDINLMQKIYQNIIDFRKHFCADETKDANKILKNTTDLIIDNLPIK